MANEIKTTLRLDLNNPAIAAGSTPVHSERFHLDDFVSDQTGVGGHAPVVSVGLAEEDISIGDVTTLGILVLRNLDDTNFVTWGPKSAGAMVALGRLKPQGEPAYLRLEPGVTLRWVADTGACKVKMLLLED